MAEINWEEIRTEYITTDTSQRKLAEKYAVPLANLTRRSTKEGWVEERRRYKDRVIAKAVKKSAGRESWRLAQLMDTTARAAAVLEGVFLDDEQFHRHLVTGDGMLEEKRLEKVDTRALKEAVGVLKDVTALMREFYDLPTPAERKAQRLAAERLRLEKEKLGEQKGAGKIEVVFEGPGKEAWSE